MAVRETAAGVIDFVRRQVDRVVSPDTRRKTWDKANGLAEARPLLASFLIAQLLFSFLPLLLFTVFALSTVAFALSAALAFILFWVGLSLLVLVPILFVAAGTAVLVWAWAVASFIAARWMYGMVAPAPVRGGVVFENERDGGKLVFRKDDTRVTEESFGDGGEETKQSL